MSIVLIANFSDTKAPPKQSLGVFSGVVVIVSIGSLVVTLNAKLLGGRVLVSRFIDVLF